MGYELRLRCLTKHCSSAKRHRSLSLMIKEPQRESLLDETDLDKILKRIEKKFSRKYSLVVYR